MRQTVEFRERGWEGRWENCDTDLFEQTNESRDLRDLPDTGGLCRVPYHHNDESAPLPLAVLPDNVKWKHIARLVVKSAGRIYWLKVDQIDWIKAAGNYVEVHVGSKSHLLRGTMNRLEARLDPAQFLRIHRSAIVNIERIKELQPWCSGDYRLLLQDGTELRLSRGYRKGLEKLLGFSL